MNLSAQTHYKSPNFLDRDPGTEIRYIVIHYTACDLELSLRTLTQSLPPNRVSAHYLICEAGKLYNLVSVEKSAWHAGVSAWGPHKNLNTWSIGIELVNSGDTPFPEPQIRTLITLCQDLRDHFAIRPEHFLGHSDIAPGRKTDPGPLFPWAKLARHGVGLFPHQEALENHGSCLSVQETLKIQKSLQRFGYALNITGQWDNQTQKVFTAFQQRFDPNDITGTPTPLALQKLSWLLRQV